MNQVVDTAAAVAHVTGGKKVKVTVSGSGAYTNGEIINIPHLGSKLDVKQVQVLRGYLDHEIAHIKNTDFAVKKPDGKLGRLYNLLEDIRIERLAGVSRGVKKNLTDLNNSIIDKMSDGGVKPLYIEGYRLVSGQKINHDCMLAEAKKLFGDDIIERMMAMHGSHDAMELAKNIITEMEEKLEDQAEEQLESLPEEQFEEDAGDDVGGGDDEGNAEENTDGGDAGNEGDDENEDDDTECAGGAGDESDAEEDEGDADSVAPANSDEIEEALNDMEGLEDKADVLRDEFNRMHCEAVINKDDYVVYSTEQDRIYKVNEAPNTNTFNYLKQSIAKGLNSTRAKFITLFKTKTAARWTGDMERGKINSKALARTAIGNRRVFKEKHQVTDIDTAITFVVDFSGSMQFMVGDLLTPAMKAVIIFLETLNGIGVKTEVLGYTTNGKIKGCPELARSTDYGRIEGLETVIFKEFNEAYGGQVKRRISNYNSVSLSENCDPCSLKVAYGRIMERREKRKIIFMLTDGEVANKGDCERGRAELKRLVEGIEKRRQVEVVGIGFNTEDVKETYKNHMLVKKHDDLAAKLFEGIKNILL